MQSTTAPALIRVRSSVAPKWRRSSAGQAPSDETSNPAAGIVGCWARTKRPPRLQLWARCCVLAKVEPDSPGPIVSRDAMKSDDQLNALQSAQLWTYIGATLFLVALLGSAIADPALRILHSVQAVIYIAVIF